MTGAGLDPDVHLLAGAHALDALDEPERLAFEEHLRACADCARESRELRETAAVLGASVAVAAPSGLRERVLAEVARTPQLPPLTGAGVSEGGIGGPEGAGAGDTGVDRAGADRAGAERAGAERAGVDGTGAGGAGAGGAGAGDAGAGDAGRVVPIARRRRAGTRLAAAAAVVALALAGGSAVIGWDRAREAERARDRLALTVDIASAPGAVRRTADVAGGGRVTVVQSSAGAAVFADGLADPGAGHVYQLWINHPGEADMRPAGLGPDGGSPAGRWTRVIEGMEPGDAFAISVEPAGGSVAPTTDPVVLIPA